MFFYKLVITYKGTNFHGWQIQAQGEKTIQGELNLALETILKSSVKTTGSGRTDTGVHAINQIVKVEAAKEIECDALRRGLNSLLPEDIRVKSIDYCSESFRPTNDAKTKEYHYYFCNGKNSNPLINDLLASSNFELDIKKMQKTCSVFLGEHDFKDFQCVGTPVTSTYRKIFSCEIAKVERFSVMDDQDNIFVLKIRGSGFLKQMVRLIVGTLWQVGRDKVTAQQIGEKLQKPNGTKLGPVAPAQGLYLASVEY